MLKYPNELIIVADCMEIRLGLRYTTSLINRHRKTQGFDAVYKSTVNLYFRRIQTKRTRIHKIQKVTNNEGKWKEARIL